VTLKNADGHHIRYDGDPVPVTVKVMWTDGTEGEVNGWTSQWTRTHVWRLPGDGAATSPVLGTSIRRQAALAQAHSSRGGRGGRS
jgi:hypothetical protein